MSPEAQSTGRFGLVAGPSGIATPAFGPDATVLRLTADALVVETGGGETDHLLAGATLGGTVLNKVDMRKSRYGYGYGQRYGYRRYGYGGYGHDNPSPKPKRPEKVA